MTERIAINRCPRLTAAATALLIAGIGLSGCSSVGDSFASTAFVDPATYELYDCEQLAAQRKSLAAQTIAQQKLIDKAKTGVAGSVMGEIAYRNPYIAIRAQAKLADDAWRRNKCEEAPAPAAAAAPAPAAPAASKPHR
ncbi:MAG: twin-arginine translocation pathway signal [Proteobacteria bacterium]|nr:twin-arginine translocation pathway signal [Pseudomonadota bacterium]